MTLLTRRLAATFGAEVSGVDLASPLDAQTAGALRELWLKHELLLYAVVIPADRGATSFADMTDAAVAVPF